MTADSSGNGNTGTLAAGVTWSTDVPPFPGPGASPAATIYALLGGMGNV